MAAVKLTPSERAKALQAAASSMSAQLERFRNSLDSVEFQVQERGRARQAGRSQSRLALAECELVLAKCEQQQAQLDHAIDDFTVMWQELRAELDLAHVLAVTPE